MTAKHMYILLFIIVIIIVSSEDDTSNILHQLGLSEHTIVMLVLLSTPQTCLSMPSTQGKCDDVKMKDAQVRISMKNQAHLRSRVVKPAWVLSTAPLCFMVVSTRRKRRPI